MVKKDDLFNGVVLGGLLGAAIVWGAPIYTWIIETVPPAWYVLGDPSLPLYLIGAGMLVGWIIDKY